MEEKKFLHNAPSKRLFWNGIHSFLRRADARGINLIELTCFNTIFDNLVVAYFFGPPRTTFGRLHAFFI